MIPLKAIHKDKEISFSIPQAWDELTLKQFIDLQRWDREDLITMLSVITGLEYDVLFASETSGIEELILQNLQWMRTPLDFESLPVPKEIMIDGKNFDVPQDIKEKTFGQKISLQLYLADAAKEGKFEIDCVAFALAVYFQPQINENKYNEDEAKKLLPIIEQCRFIDAYPVANFFLSKFLE